MTTPYGAPIPSPLPEAPLSVNFKIPEIPGSPQLTVRAGNGAELAGLTEDVARHGLQVGRALTEFRAGVLAGSGIQDAAPAAPQSSVQTPPPAQPQQYPGQQAPQWGNQPAYPAPQQQQQGYPAPAPQTGATGPAPTCPHGTRVYRSGVSKTNGRPYKMWACPAPQSDPSQCKPEYV